MWEAEELIWTLFTQFQEQNKYKYIKQHLTTGDKNQIIKIIVVFIKQNISTKDWFLRKEKVRAPYSGLWYQGHLRVTQIGLRSMSSVACLRGFWFQVAPLHWHLGFDWAHDFSFLNSQLKFDRHTCMLTVIVIVFFYSVFYRWYSIFLLQKAFPNPCLCLLVFSLHISHEILWSHLDCTGMDLCSDFRVNLLGLGV